MKKLFSVLSMVAMLAVPGNASETFTIDNAHSAIHFSIRHFFSKVPGRFNTFSGTIVADRENPAGSSVECVIRTESIDTGNAKRDQHLRAADFFNAEKNPEIRFKSTKIEVTGENSGKITGDLTMNGITKPVTLDVTFLGMGPGMNGGVKSGWNAKTKINRKDFGITWNQMVEGSAVLGDEVEIDIDIEANKS